MTDPRSRRSGLDAPMFFIGVALVALVAPEIFKWNVHTAAVLAIGSSLLFWACLAAGGCLALFRAVSTHSVLNWLEVAACVTLLVVFLLHG